LPRPKKGEWGSYPYQVIKLEVDLLKEIRKYYPARSYAESVRMALKDLLRIFKEKNVIAIVRYPSNDEDKG